MTKKHLDKRRKYYMILDCETATLPFVSDYDSAESKKKIAIAKPLIYDFAYQIIDKKGRVYIKRSFLVSEVFSVPAVFNTAYFANKRPIYIQRLKEEKTSLKTWNEITKIFMQDLEEVNAVGAFNSMFDFKKAIPFTETYIKALYSDNYKAWENKQKAICKKIIENKKEPSKKFDSENFIFRHKKYPLFDLWGLACEYLLNNDEYKEKCIENGWCTNRKYFPTNAEKTYAYIAEDDDFSESHTAIDDAEIESVIFVKIVKEAKNKVNIGITYFPFRILGTVEKYLE